MRFRGRDMPWRWHRSRLIYVAAMFVAKRVPYPWSVRVRNLGLRMSWLGKRKGAQGKHDLR